MAYNVLSIANKLLKKAELVTESELMSNMRLQKMLYYEQGYHLAVFGTPLFDEEIEAWMYGPVVPCVYEHYKSYGAGGIEPQNTQDIQLTDDEEILLQEVYDAYAEFSTYGLMVKTHKEAPWMEMDKKGQIGVGCIIEKEVLKKFFEKEMA